MWEGRKRRGGTEGRPTMRDTVAGTRGPARWSQCSGLRGDRGTGARQRISGQTSADWEARWPGMLTAKAPEKDRDGGSRRRGQRWRHQRGGPCSGGRETLPEITGQLRHWVGSSQGSRKGPSPGGRGACRPLSRNISGGRLGLLTLREGPGTGCDPMPFNSTTTNCGQTHQ